VIAVSDEDKKALKRRPGLKSVGTVFRKRNIGEKVEMEASFFITSHEPKVRALAEHIRSHWGIENSQHHTLDVTCDRPAQDPS